MIRLLFFLLCPFYLLGQPIIEWENHFGSFMSAFKGEIVQMPDSSYVIAAWAFAGTFPSGSYGGNDAQLYKVDKDGNLVWQKNYGGSGNDNINKLRCTNEGQIVAVGFTSSNDYDISGNKGKDDAWVLVLDADGNILSSKTFGGSESDGFEDILTNDEGGWSLLGNTISMDGDFDDPDTLKTGVLVKINNSWEMEEAHKFFMIASSYTQRFVKLVDGDYIIAGTAFLGAAGDLDKSDINLTRINSNGDVIWSKTYGGEKQDYFRDISIFQDKIFVAAESYVGPYQGIIDNTDYWVFSIDLDGNTRWGYKFGGSAPEWVSNIIALPNEEVIVAGSTYSRELTDNIGASVWLLKIDKSGKIVWQETFDDENSDIVTDFCPTADGGFILLAAAGGDFDGIWAVKLAPEDLRVQEECQPQHLYPNPVQGNKLMVEFKNPSVKPAKIELFDIAGKLVYVYQQEEIGFDRTIEITLPINLASGIYLVKTANCNDEPVFTKLIKLQ